MCYTDKGKKSTTWWKAVYFLKQILTFFIIILVHVQEELNLQKKYDILNIRCQSL